jgi:hypothetical protein
MLSYRFLGVSGLLLIIGLQWACSDGGNPPPVGQGGAAAGGGGGTSATGGAGGDAPGGAGGSFSQGPYRPNYRPGIIWRITGRGGLQDGTAISKANQRWQDVRDLFIDVPYQSTSLYEAMIDRSLGQAHCAKWMYFALREYLIDDGVWDTAAADDDGWSNWVWNGPTDPVQQWVDGFAGFADDPELRFMLAYWDEQAGYPSAWSSWLMGMQGNNNTIIDYTDPDARAALLVFHRRVIRHWLDVLGDKMMAFEINEGPKLPLGYTQGQFHTFLEAFYDMLGELNSDPSLADVTFYKAHGGAIGPQLDRVDPLGSIGVTSVHTAAFRSVYTQLIGSSNGHGVGDAISMTPPGDWDWGWEHYNAAVRNAVVAHEPTDGGARRLHFYQDEPRETGVGRRFDSPSGSPGCDYTDGEPSTLPLASTISFSSGDFIGVDKNCAASEITGYDSQANRDAWQVGCSADVLLWWGSSPPDKDVSALPASGVVWCPNKEIVPNTSSPDWATDGRWWSRTYFEDWARATRTVLDSGVRLVANPVGYGPIP